MARRAAWAVAVCAIAWAGFATSGTLSGAASSGKPTTTKPKSAPIGKTPPPKKVTTPRPAACRNACLAASPTSGAPPLTVKFTWTIAAFLRTAAAGSISFGDGARSPSLTLSALGGTVGHTYAKAGTYVALLNVYLTRGGSLYDDRVTIAVKVKAAPKPPPTTTTAPTGGAISVGVNDDAGKFADGAATFWDTMSSVGLQQNAMTVLWDETRPTAILDQSFIQHSLPAAKKAGIKVVLDVYPMHSQALTKDPANVQRFADFLGRLARTFPSVTEYVVMNECNQPRFVNPQFGGTAKSSPNASAAVCGEALAAGYDALKAVDPDIFVWGVGLSPRGNDDPTAASNVSTSPVRFLAALGAWYRSSGRAQPLMDGFAFHPYPVPQSLAFETGYADKENASVSNLPRIYQAFYDAFKGTGQKTIGQQAGGGLPVALDEVGIQTLTGDAPGYTGSEVSNATTGVVGATATEAYQADWYLKMLKLVSCDAQVRFVNIFHLVDEAELAFWQSGLYYVGYQPKQSASAVQQWLDQTGGRCAGSLRGWTPAGVTTTTTTAKTTTTTAVTIPPPLPKITKPELEVTAAPDGGTAPLTTKLRIKTKPANLVSRWEINFDDGSTDEGKGDPPDTITHTYRLGIRYDPEVTIYFGNARSEEHIFKRVPVIVSPKEPFRFAVDVEKLGLGEPPLMIRFHPKYSWDEPPTRWSLDFGDGKSQAGTGKLPATIEHVYAKQGTFKALAKVQARDGHGNLFDTSVPITIEVKEPPPRIGFAEGGPTWTIANGKILVTGFDFRATWSPAVPGRYLLVCGGARWAGAMSSGQRIAFAVKNAAGCSFALYGRTKSGDVLMWEAASGASIS